MILIKGEYCNLQCESKSLKHLHGLLVMAGSKKKQQPTTEILKKKWLETDKMQGEKNILTITEKVTHTTTHTHPHTHMSGFTFLVGTFH